MEGHEKIHESLEKQQPHSLLADPPLRDHVIVRFEGGLLTNVYLPAMVDGEAELVRDNLQQNAESGVMYEVRKSSPVPV